MRVDNGKQVVAKKNPTRQKIIVEQGRQFGTPIVEHKVLYTEIAPDLEIAKQRVKELQEEYKETDALSVSYFSL